MKNFKISESLVKTLDGILSELTSKYSENELLIIDDLGITSRSKCDCGGGCAGSCRGQCGGCGSACSGFLL